MPLTLSGRSVTAENDVAPSIVDIAVGLSRMPRFAGQTRRWWSVLDHTLFGDELVKQESHHDLRRARLAWLLHDAHECVTADVPTPFKDAYLRMQQAFLDEDIYDAYFPGRYLEARAFTEFVKVIDRRCLTAEALVVGPPTAEQHPKTFGPFPGYENWAASDGGVLTRAIGRGILGKPPQEWDAEDHPGVKDFLSRYMELR